MGGWGMGRGGLVVCGIPGRRRLSQTIEGPTITCYGLGWGALHGAEGQARQSLYRTIKTVEKPVESQRREKMVTASGIDERWKS